MSGNAAPAPHLHSAACHARGRMADPSPPARPATLQPTVREGPSLLAKRPSPLRDVGEAYGALEGVGQLANGDPFHKPDSYTYWQRERGARHVVGDAGRHRKSISAQSWRKSIQREQATAWGAFAGVCRYCIPGHRGRLRTGGPCAAACRVGALLAIARVGGCAAGRPRVVGGRGPPMPDRRREPVGRNGSRLARQRHHFHSPE